MYIALIIWLIFLFAYVAFNIYGVFKVYQMHIKGDLTRVAILIYLLIIFIIIAVSLAFISRLNWSTTKFF
ncbi:MAG: hypothetical protein ABSE91_01880 [Patescibacteria group bacterium]|jgi:hypothetical protein